MQDHLDDQEAYSVRRLRRFAASYVLVLGLFAVAPSSAVADTQMHCGTNCDGCVSWSGSDAPADGCPDGNWFIRSGSVAYGSCWSQGNWTQLAGCTNHDVEIVNNGYACSGCDHINIYYGFNYSGAWACESRGDAWYKGSGGVVVYFDHGAGKAGYGQSVWNNAASVKWVGSC